MKARVVVFGLLLATASVVMAATPEQFSKEVRPDDFAAAGLNKLTPAEIEKLDTLVRDYKSGALAAARRELAAAEAKAARAEADARAADAKAAKVAQTDKQPGPSLLDRAKVLLKPGTKVEYSTLESRLAHEFRGWERNTVFTLENGQRWRAVGESSYATPPVPAPRVKVTPGALGAFFMEIEGVRQRVKVESLDAR